MAGAIRKVLSTPFTRGLAAIALVLLVTGPVQASVAHSAICEHVAVEAAGRTGVPLDVLRAISLTETGRKSGGAFRPWPWTVNMEGEGLWFDAEDDARAYVYKEYKRGARSFDVGCFQINYKWHGQAFASIDEMFDPYANAFYAAKLLRELHAETGSWSKAAGAYHSRTPELAEKYRARFDRIRNELGDDDRSPEPPAPSIPEIPDIVLAANADGQTGAGWPETPQAPRDNRFPLLRQGAAAGLGSLVPLDGVGQGVIALARDAPGPVE